ncbi:hypothetical protein BIW11_00688 [Tropilaelaps mercedesae]|uniref:Secreted protein n=1 Tax=Tropilaelaps mercedesae TaxID=418985 RepID=A0A1V9XQW5_9ACAR|nr:hypothetical protein BIW11_00688 [Tropilaelaps mercedesae]
MFFFLHSALNVTLSGTLALKSLLESANIARDRSRVRRRSNDVRAHADDFGRSPASLREGTAIALTNCFHERSLQAMQLSALDFVMCTCEAAPINFVPISGRLRSRRRFPDINNSLMSFLFSA